MSVEDQQAENEAFEQGFAQAVASRHRHPPHQRPM